MIENLIYAAPAITLGIGYFWGRHEEKSKAKYVAAKQIVGLTMSQERLADALEAKNERLERIIEQETPGANATVKRMAAIARGEA